MKSFIEFFSSVNEDLPTNNAGSGHIDGIGVGVNSEPGVTKKKKYRFFSRKNKEAADVRSKSARQGRDH